MCLENTKTIRSSLLATIHLIIFHPHLSTIYLARSHPWRRRGFQFSTELQIVCKKRSLYSVMGSKFLSSLFLKVWQIFCAFLIYTVQWVQKISTFSLLDWLVKFKYCEKATKFESRLHPWWRRGFQFSTELQIVCKKGSLSCVQWV